MLNGVEGAHRFLIHISFRKRGKRNAKLRKEKIDVQETAGEYYKISFEKSHRIIGLIYSSVLDGRELYAVSLSFVNVVDVESSLKAVVRQCPSSIQGPFIDTAK